MPTNKIPDDPQYYVTGLLEGNRHILAKTITVIESSHPSHQDLAGAIVDRILPYTGKAVRLGVTGVPGVGKSMFIESLGMILVNKGHKLAVLAVDPSSKRSGGSIMADKMRMEKLSTEPNAFIRPSPSGSTLGGVARKTREAMLVCEAAGFDVIIVETVGVGQSETEVSSMVDFFLVLMLAGAGDIYQGIKKGVLEIADAIAITKADGDNIEKACQARMEYETALHIIAPLTKTWSPPVVICSSTEKTGIEEIWDIVIKHRDRMLKSGELDINRKKQMVNWMWALIKEGLKERFYGNPDIKKLLPKIIRDVENGVKAPTIASNELLFFLDNKSVTYKKHGSGKL